MIRLKGYKEDRKREIAAILKSKLDGLQEKIDEIISLKTGLNINTRPTAFDLILIVEFKNEDALNVYRSHPEHVKVLDFMRTLNLGTAVVDFED